MLGIAFGLAMDAFSVAVAAGLLLGKVTLRQSFRLSFHFGLFQFFMPILGWVGGVTVERHISAYDHWLAFFLLGYVGGKMVWESLQSEDKGFKTDPTRGVNLMVLSIATSIDAFAVGLSFGLLRVSVFQPAVVIGIIAAVMTLLGLQLGRRAGHLLGRWMETMGGLVLIAIGAKILVEHLLGG